MITYNHEKYIREAIEGVLMQQTNFRIELIISEDCSTDGTRDIVREYADRYPEIIVPDLPETNRGMNENSNHCISLVRGKYIASCEGDDYWSDPLKLQKQVDFLEANPEYGLVFAGAISYFQKSKTFDNNPHLPKEICSLNELIIRNSINTLTTCLRKDLFLQYMTEIKPQERNWMIGDYPIWIWFVINSKIYCLQEYMGVYRVLEESGFHSKDPKRYINLLLSSLSVKIFFINKYNLDTKYLYKAQSYIYGLCHPYALECQDWDILREEIMVLKKTKEKKRLIKCRINYIFRNHPKTNFFLTSIASKIHKFNL